MDLLRAVIHREVTVQRFATLPSSYRRTAATSVAAGEKSASGARDCPSGDGALRLVLKGVSTTTSVPCKNRGRRCYGLRRVSETVSTNQMSEQGRGAASSVCADEHWDRAVGGGLHNSPRRSTSRELGLVQRHG